MWDGARLSLSARANRQGFYKPSVGPKFMNNVLTASRQNCLASCPRKHFWTYEIGLKKDEQVGLALRFGGAWARATEARWKGMTYEEALAYAIPEGVDIDLHECAKLAALLAAYYDHYGPVEVNGKMKPEKQFQFVIEGAEDFTAEGKMDVLGVLNDGRDALIEGKTTRCSLASDSDYWLRLKRNVQILQYLSAARKLNMNVSVCYYDVVRKPAIRPRKEVNDLDENGLKIVIDRDGNRVMNLAGKNKGQPRQGGDSKKGYVVKSHPETPDEYSDRLYADVLSRTDYYFCRWEIPVLDDHVDMFEQQRIITARLIDFYRSHEGGIGDPGQVSPRNPLAWPKNVLEQNCKFCPFSSFCLQGIEVNPQQPPNGFSIGQFNPELERTTDDETADENDTD